MNIAHTAEDLGLLGIKYQDHGLKIEAIKEGDLFLTTLYQLGRQTHQWNALTHDGHRRRIEWALKYIVPLVEVVERAKSLAVHTVLGFTFEQFTIYTWEGVTRYHRSNALTGELIGEADNSTEDVEDHWSTLPNYTPHTVEFRMSSKVFPGVVVRCTLRELVEYGEQASIGL